MDYYYFKMNILSLEDYITMSEMDLPCMGLIRTTNDIYPKKNSLYLERKKTCFHYQLKNRCDSIQTYNDIYQDYNKTIYNLEGKLPEDIIYHICSFYKPEKCIKKIPPPSYKNIIPNYNYRWYIIISNCLTYIHDKNHKHILNISKYIYDYEEGFKVLMHYIYNLVDFDKEIKNIYELIENIFMTSANIYHNIQL